MLRGRGRSCGILQHRVRVVVGRAEQFGKGRIIRSRLGGPTRILLAEECGARAAKGGRSTPAIACGSPIVVSGIGGRAGELEPPFGEPRPATAISVSAVCGRGGRLCRGSASARGGGKPFAGCPSPRRAAVPPRPGTSATTQSPDLVI